ncbi:extensin family protein [Rubellimicrobium rubrum]|uniref:extensin-like domain-containing protein n=1 Tax=Rubellimicrobium rubrum TaxID=2585369 RepID=UPI00159B895D|nr:extensin family protein [Rubellimicrobium rubrum]
MAALTDLGVTFVTGDPITEAEDRDCGMVNPVTITEIATGVDLEPDATLRCSTALAAARWVADAVGPFSQKLGDRGRLVGLDNGTAYLCRPRADGETSEHAFGNALDIMAFRFERGDPIPVQPRGGDGTIEESFQRAVRSAACLDFTTVLGPGSDPDHRDHLHLDVKWRENGFRICQ